MTDDLKPRQRTDDFLRCRLIEITATRHTITRNGVALNHCHHRTKLAVRAYISDQKLRNGVDLLPPLTLF